MQLNAGHINVNVGICSYRTSSNYTALSITKSLLYWVVRIDIVLRSTQVQVYLKHKWPIAIEFWLMMWQILKSASYNENFNTIPKNVRFFLFLSMWSLNSYQPLLSSYNLFPSIDNMCLYNDIMYFVHKQLLRY